MSSERYFSYYYGRECEQFAFYRIPKILITDPYFCGLSAEAKLLYGLMLDRMCLSQRNGWFDDQGRVYIIFTQKEIQRDLRVGKNTASRLTVALEECGLIRKVRRGQGMPDLIYVMNFASGERPGEPEYDLDLPEEYPCDDASFDMPTESRMVSHRSPDLLVQSRSRNVNREESASSKQNQGSDIEENVNLDCIAGNKNYAKITCFVSENVATDPEIMKDELPVEIVRSDPNAEKIHDEYAMDSLGESRSLKNKPLGRSLKSKPLDSSWESDAQKFKNQTSSHPKMGRNNKTDINKTNINIYNKSSSSSKVNQDLRENTDCRGMSTEDYTAGLSYSEIINAVKEKIEYDTLVLDFDEDEVSIFPTLIAEMLYTCRSKSEITVGRITYNAVILRQRFLELSYVHIQSILTIIQENHISPKNIRSYYIQSLYNAVVTTDAYYARRVDYDMHSVMAAV